MSNYILYCDGASKRNPGPSGIGCVLYKDGSEIFVKGKYIGNATNNIAEYMSAIYGLQESYKLGVKNIILKMDSELVIKQINGEYKVKNEKLKKLNLELTQLISKFDDFKAEHIYREYNSKADNIASQMALIEK